MNKNSNNTNENFNATSFKLNLFGSLIFLLTIIPGVILFFTFLEGEKVGLAFISLLSFVAIASFFSTLLEALAQIVSFCQQIAKNTNPNKKTIETKIVKYRCKKCGNIIDTLPCPICNKTESKSDVLPVNNTLCDSCGADVSNDLQKCHVCGKDI